LHQQCYKILSQNIISKDLKKAIFNAAKFSIQKKPVTTQLPALYFLLMPGILIFYFSQRSQSKYYDATILLLRSPLRSVRCVKPNAIFFSRNVRNANTTPQRFFYCVRRSAVFAA
jgi:hypothetical protein